MLIVHETTPHVNVKSSTKKARRSARAYTKNCSRKAKKNRLQTVLRKAASKLPCY